MLGARSVCKRVVPRAAVRTGSRGYGMTSVRWAEKPGRARMTKYLRRSLKEAIDLNIEDGLNEDVKRTKKDLSQRFDNVRYGGVYNCACTLRRKFGTETIEVKFSTMMQTEFDDLKNSPPRDEPKPEPWDAPNDHFDFMDQDVLQGMGVKFAVKVMKEDMDKFLFLDCIATNKIEVCTVALLSPDEAKWMKKNKTKGSVYVVDEMEHKIRDGWQKYLERRGIDKNFGILLHSYTNWKDQSEFENFHMDCIDFMEAS